MRKLEGIVFEGNIECNKHLETISLKIIRSEREKFSAVLEDQGTYDIEGLAGSGFISFKREVPQADGTKKFVRYQGAIEERGNTLSIKGTWQYSGTYHTKGQFTLKQQNL